eukprot:CAMPEP_0178982196 /NCGR_PEP_ID=MMETSP0795-20121207/365_1 /TAXON_ID=88552 /ORGANISM="Amoebophrya sp., Strain Ameob2" /LENGTH=293 /DNA_ID=CAMNT_0020672821 /DNA_START=544 /DNA_END=1427 /DNA_ORIENTATION=+
MHWMSARSTPRRSSWSSPPDSASNILMSVPLSLALATSVPSKLSDSCETLLSWAVMSVVFSRQFCIRVKSPPSFWSWLVLRALIVPTGFSAGRRRRQVSSPSGRRDRPEPYGPGWRIACMSPRVREGLNVVYQSQVAEPVDVHFPVYEDEHDVAAQLDLAHLGAEAEFCDAARRLVVPDHHLVRLKPGICASAHEGQNVAAEQHCDDAQTAAALKLAPKRKPKRIRVVHSESIFGAADEAGLILVECDVQNLIARVRGQVHLAPPVPVARTANAGRKRKSAPEKQKATQPRPY